MDLGIDEKGAIVTGGSNAIGLAIAEALVDEVTELTKTLELNLSAPNAHRRRKRREAHAASQQALQDAFGETCPTETEANDGLPGEQRRKVGRHRCRRQFGTVLAVGHCRVGAERCDVIDILFVARLRVRGER